MSSRGSKNRALQPDHLDSAGDFFLGDQLTLARAGANYTGFLPGLRSDNVGFPKGPSPALSWPNWINSASRLSIVEDTFAFVFLLYADVTVIAQYCIDLSLMLA